MTRIAVFADVHGNLPALEAVLADLAGRGAELVLNLGDCVSGPLWPAATAARMIASGIPAVRGNHDRWVAEPPAQPGASDLYAMAETSAAQRDWLGGLPAVLRPLPGLLACHGTPADDNAYLLEDPVAGQLALAPEAAIRARLGDAAGLRLVLCAHSHQARVVTLGDLTLVNPGSAGCPAYEDPGAATPHNSETGSPVARYALLEVAADGGLVAAQLLALPYDWAAAARRAESLGSPRWAHALRHGRMPGPG